MRLPIRKMENEPPEYYKMAKPPIQIPDWMDDCMNGAPHPLNIEIDNYIRTSVGVGHMDLSYNPSYPGSSLHNLSQEEEEFVQIFKDRPEVQWAMHNSFDGLYMKKTVDHADMKVFFSFAVYMKDTNKTYWLLKYRDQARL